jgi:hypothetical protein
MKNRGHSRLVSAALLIWLAVTVTGFWRFHTYSTAAGKSGSTGALSPTDPVEQAGRSCPRLIVFAHPRCPCTRATLAELAILLERNQEATAVDVYFVRPSGATEDWEKTALWQAAAAIPGVRVHCDEGGVRARQLGAETSGHVLLYGSEGQLLFSGGITRARGQEGDSIGRRAIEALVTGKPAPSEAPVFGCPLFTPEE